MPLTVDERTRIARSEDLDARERKLEERERILTAREQELSKAPPKRDLAWERQVAQREARVLNREREQSAFDQQLTGRVHVAKAAEERAETTIGESQRLASLAQDEQAKAGQLLRDAVVKQDEALASQKDAQGAIDNLNRLRTALKAERDQSDAAAVQRDQEFASRSAQRKTELDALEASLNAQRDAQATIGSQQADLQRLLEQERTPELQKLQERLDAREKEIGKRETSLTSREQQTSKQEAAQESERKRLSGFERGINEREALIDRREAECTRKEQEISNRERAMKAKQG